MKFTTSMGTVYVRKGAKVGWVEEDNCQATNEGVTKTLKELAQYAKQQNPNLEYVGFQTTRIGAERLLMRMWQVEPNAYFIEPFATGDTRPQGSISVITEAAKEAIKQSAEEEVEGKDGEG